MGDARGHWDGAALVVESSNYKDRSMYRNANAATLRLIERFTLYVGESDRVVGDRQRSGDVDETVDILDAAHEDRYGSRVLEFACHEGS